MEAAQHLSLTPTEVGRSWLRKDLPDKVPLVPIGRPAFPELHWHLQLRARQESRTPNLTPGADTYSVLGGIGLFSDP